VHVEQVCSSTLPASDTPVPLQTGGSRAHIEKLNTVNAFYADHSQSLQSEMKGLVSLAKTMTQDEKAKEIPYLGRLIQYADVVQSNIDALVQFSAQNSHDYQHQMIFDINTVLDAVSSAAIPFLSEQGIELIFEVNSNVPARLKGYPLGTTDALVRILELIAHARVQGELIMRLSLEESVRDNGSVLHAQFMQNHYRGSVTNVVLSAIRKDQQFAPLVAQMDAIDGAILHSDHDARGDILQLSFRVQTLERRSYRLPSKDIMEKSVLIIDDRKKNAEVLQKMLQYFHLFSTVSPQLDEAMAHILDHEYDIVLVPEKIAERCAKRCKQARRGEKFIVIYSGQGTQGAYLGLDIADSFLKEPYTHKGIFNAIVDIFSDRNVEGRMEGIETLKSYVSLLGKGRQIVYVGGSGMAVRSMVMLLEETPMRLELTRDISSLHGGDTFDFVLMEIEPALLRDTAAALETYLRQGSAASRDGRVVCVLPEEIEDADLEAIAQLDFVITYLQEPIDPEVFYKILLDWALES